MKTLSDSVFSKNQWASPCNTLLKWLSGDREKGRTPFQTYLNSGMFQLPHCELKFCVPEALHRGISSVFLRCGACSPADNHSLSCFISGIQNIQALWKKPKPNPKHRKQNLLWLLQDQWRMQQYLMIDSFRPAFCKFALVSIQAFSLLHVSLHLVWKELAAAPISLSLYPHTLLCTGNHFSLRPYTIRANKVRWAYYSNSVYSDNKLFDLQADHVSDTEYISSLTYLLIMWNPLHRHLGCCSWTVFRGREGASRNNISP